MNNKRIKSAHFSYSVDSKHKNASRQMQKSEALPQIPDKIRKWQQISKQVTQQLQLCLYSVQGLPNQSLEKFGGVSFSLGKNKSSNKVIRPLRPITPANQINKVVKNRVLQQFRVNEKDKRSIKRTSRQFAQLKTNIQYDRLVLKIGSNMQYQQKLVKQHIENIKKVQILEPTPVPIVFCMKSETENYNACITNLKDDEISICIALFAQSFDAKIQQSKIKRHVYISKLKKLMNGTYDPEIMSKIPLVFKKKQFEQTQYFGQLNKFRVSIKNEQRKRLEDMACKIFDKFEYKTSAAKKQRLKQQVICNYQQGCAIANFDYYLKDEDNLKQMNMMRQYLVHKKEHIVSFRVYYHGGYSKSLYSQWHNFVKSARAELPKRVHKLSSKVQQVNKWIYQFNQLNYFQTKLLSVIISPIRLDQMKNLQLQRIQQTFNIFYNLCVKGVMTILQHNRFLSKGQDEIAMLKKGFTRYNYLKPHNEAIKNIFRVNLNAQDQLFEWYSQFLDSAHSYHRVQKFDQLVPTNCSNQIMSQAQRKKLNKSIQILMNIFYENMISQSLSTFITTFSMAQKPYLKLNLIVDRQSLKLQETQQDVLDIFNQMISSILKKSVHCTSAGMRIRQQDSRNFYKQFGNIYICEKSEETTRCANAWELNIEYRNYEIQQKNVKRLISKIKQWYHQSQLLMQHFASFMPFIKLTAKQKIFTQEQQSVGKSQWDQAKQIFQTNRQKVLFYKQKLNEIPKKFTVGIFEVDCTQPHKILRQRISQMQYLFQQKFLSRIYQKIHQMQQQLSKIMTLLHSTSIKVSTMQQISQNFHKCKCELQQIKAKTKQLSKHIYFYIQQQTKSSSLITRLAQLIHKRKQLYAQIQQLKERVKEDAYYAERKRQEQCVVFRAKIQQFTLRLANFCRDYFEISKLDKYLGALKGLKEEFSQFENQFNQAKDPNHQYENEQQFFQQTNNKINIVYSYWQHLNNFNSIVKQLNRQKIGEIQMEEYQKTVKSSVKVIQQFQELNIQINEINKGYLQKFKEEVSKHMEYLQYIQILTNKSIPTEYYQLFKCQVLLGLTFKEIYSAQSINKYKSQLKQLLFMAQAEQLIFKNYKEIQKKFQLLRLSIVDLHGCDTLDPQHTKQQVQILRQSAFQCQKLLLSKYSKKYEKKIYQLKQKMQLCAQIMLKWLLVQRKFLQLQAFYRNNDDAYFKQNFKSIAQSHRKIIKSFDMDNSVLLLPSNVFLVSSLQSSQMILDQQKLQIFDKFNELQSCNSRLQLLSHEQLLQMTSKIKTVSKHLPKILPTIKNIAVNDESIERVGGFILNHSDMKDQPNQPQKIKKQEVVMGNYLQLRQSILLGSRLVNVQIWLQRLINDIKQSMRQMFFGPTKRQTCLQIIILKDQLQFSQEVQQIFLQQQPISVNLQRMLKATQQKIEQKSKIDFQKYHIQMVTLMLIMQRDLLTNLISLPNCNELSQKSFEWIKNPRMYNRAPKSQTKKTAKADIRLKVVNQQYQYNFMFIEECQIVVQDVIFIGNCIVGPRGCGKRSIIRNYAFLSGNQLFQLQKNRISQNYIENIVNYYKLAITTGSWLMIPRINEMSTEELRVIAECLCSMNQAIASKLQKMQMFVYNEFPINEQCRVFFTLQNISSIPVRLTHNFRPIWMSRPSIEFINSVYNQSICTIQTETVKRSNYYSKQYENLFKILDFLYWNKNDKEVPLYFAKFMARYLSTQKKMSYLSGNTSNKFLNTLINIKFILPQDLGSHYEAEDNIDRVIQNYKQSIIYLSQLEFNNFIMNNFCEQNSIWINLRQTNFTTMKHIYDCIKSTLLKKKISYVLIQKSLYNYDLIQKQIANQLINKHGIKVIYFENINQLSAQQSLRMFLNLPTVIISKQNIKIDSEKGTKLRKINFKSAYLTYDSFVQLDQNYQRFINSLTAKYLKSQIANQQIQQTMKSFSKLYMRMLNAGYFKQVALIFSVAWIFGNLISQKNLLQELNSVQYKFSLDKIIRNCVNLRQIYPTKFSFIAFSDGMEENHKLILNQGQITFKSITLSNIKLLRQLLRNQTVLIKSQHEIEQLMNIIFHQYHHLYPVELKSPIITKNIIQHALRIKQSKGLYKFVIHSLDKINSDSFKFITELALKACGYYYEKDDLKIFTQKMCQFTFSSNLDIEMVSYNSVTIKITTDQIIAIQSDMLNSLIKQKKSSINFDESILKGLNSSYRSLLTKYYWFQHPIRPTLKKFLKNSTNSPNNNFFIQLLRNEFLVVPNQKIKLVNQICYSATPISLVKSQQSQYQIKMSNLSQTNNYLQETLMKSQTEIRKSICKDIIVLSQNFSATPYTYEMLYKTFLAISDCHTILVGCVFTQRYYCLQMAAKILNLQIVSFSQQIFEKQISFKKEGQKKNILLIKQIDINEDLLRKLQSYICKQDSILNKNYVVVLKIMDQIQETQNLYKRYPFLKKYFVNVYFPKNSKQQITQSINLVKTLKFLEGGENRYQLSILNDWQIPSQLQVEKNIVQYFEKNLKKNFSFLVKLLELRKQFEEQQFNKYKFYRTLTQQLFHIVSQFEYQLQIIPSKLQQFKSKQNELSACNKTIQKGYQALLGQIQILQNQLSAVEQNLQGNMKIYQDAKERIQQGNKQLEATFKKIYSKIENLSIQQHSKFKTSADNELANWTYNLISGLIKWQASKMKKISVSKLHSILNSKQSQGKLEKNKQTFKKIVNMWKNNKKKNEKIGTIFILLIQWIQTVEQSFRINDENQKTQQFIIKIQQEICTLKKNCGLARQKIEIKKKQMQECSKLRQQNIACQNERVDKIKIIKIRKERIQKILKQVTDKEYKIKISKDLAERLYFIPKIIMSKSINQISLNEYEDDQFLAKQLYLRSAKEEETAAELKNKAKDQDYLKFGIPLFYNIFDDFDAVVSMCNKFSLHELDYEQVRLIYTIIYNKQRVQFIEDAYEIIAPKFCQICQNQLNYKILNLGQSTLQVVIKQLKQKSMSFQKILVTLSRYEKEDQIKKLLRVVVNILSQNEKVKIIFIFKRFESIYQTDRFRWISDGKVSINFRRYLKQFAKIVQQRQFHNEWQYYLSQHQFNKSHKILFEVIEKFNPQHEQSYNLILEVIKKLQQARTKRQTNFHYFQQYYEYLATVSSNFWPFYILLKFIQSIDRINPIQLFEVGNLFKNFQLALKKAMAELYDTKVKKNADLLKKFIIAISNAINFVDQEQVNQFCMIVMFVILKPPEITPYFIFKVLREGSQFKKQSQRIQYIIKITSANTVNLSLSSIQQLISKRNLQKICDDWLKFLIYATAPNYRHYSQNFINSVKQSQHYEIIQNIKERGLTTQNHYYISKTKLDFKNQLKLAVTTSRQRACKTFWVIKVKRQHSQKFMEVLENKVKSLKQEIKLVSFFFNQGKFNDNFDKLKKLSQKKLFLCIFNLSTEKILIAEQIIWILSRNKNINPMFKLFFLFQDSVQLKNREYIDYISFLPSQMHHEQNLQKSIQQHVSKILNNTKQPLKIKQNMQIFSSLHVIVQKCASQMGVCKQKDKIFKFLLSQILKPEIIDVEGNVLKFLAEYFRASDISIEDIDQFCRIKQPLMFFTQSNPSKGKSRKSELEEESLQKWVGMLQKIQTCTTIQSKYLAVIKMQIENVIQKIISKQQPNIIINQSHIRNIVKYGWIIVQKYEILKFLLYRGLKQGLKDSLYGDCFELITQLKIVCEKGSRNFGFNFAEFNQILSSQNIVSQIELKIKAVQQVHEQALIDKFEIEQILQHYNLRFSLAGDKQTLGILYITFK